MSDWRDDMMADMEITIALESYEKLLDRIEELEAENDALKVEMVRVRARVYYLCREMKEALISQTSTLKGEEK